MEELTIGAFARLTHLPPRALRLYDQQQLLQPAHVDPGTGYRWYAAEQVPRARRVALLRSVDMPLARIRRVLDLPDADAAREIAAFWAEQEQAAAAAPHLSAPRDRDADDQGAMVACTRGRATISP